MRWSAAGQRKKLAAEAKNYCIYFLRFGRCSRGDKCRYIHDPDKVSVCTRCVISIFSYVRLIAFTGHTLVSVFLTYVSSKKQQRYYCCLLLMIMVMYLLNTTTHTRLTVFFLGLPRWASTRKVKPIWILLKQETVSGSGISWAICKSAPSSRQTAMPAPTTQFLQAGCPSCRPTNRVKAMKGVKYHQ